MAKSFNTLKIKLSAESKARIDKRVKTALAEMSLAELRQARKLTQQQIAETESNRLWYPKWRVRLIYMYISTIRKYIEAIGGELEIIARFPEGNVNGDNFESIES